MTPPRHKSEPCRHHWLLEETKPGRATVWGRCCLCGIRRDFPAYFDPEALGISNAKLFKIRLRKGPFVGVENTSKSLRRYPEKLRFFK